MILIKGKLEKLNSFVFKIIQNKPLILTKAILVGWLFLFLGCDGPNHDDNEQISCTQAQGLWIMSEVKCNEATLEAPVPSIINFKDQEKMKWTFGAANCQKSVDNIYHLQGDLLDIYGTNFQSCKADGTTASGCSGQETSCSNTIPGSLVTHNVDSCVIEYGKLKLKRQSSQKLIGQNFNYCQAGQTETIFYSKISNEDGSLNFNVGDGWNFIEEIFPFNSSEIAPVVITNFGKSDITDLKFEIRDPFEFAGGSYPGSDAEGRQGTCGRNIPPASKCTLYLQFHPTVPGEAKWDMPFSYFNGKQTKQGIFALEGFALEPSALIRLAEGQSTDFGTITAKTSEKLIVTLKNIGTHTATNLRLTDETPPFYFSGQGGFPGDIPPGSCNQPLLPESECTIEFEFRPDGPGIFAHTFTLTYKNGIDLESGFEGTSTLAITFNGQAISSD